MKLKPLKIRFYTKRKSAKSERHILYMRMVMDKSRVDISLGLTIDYTDWDPIAQKLSPRHPDKNVVSNLTNEYRQRATAIYQSYLQKGMECDVYIIRNLITGNENSGEDVEPTLLKLFDRLIDRKKKLPGKNNTKATIQKYHRCMKHLKNFMNESYNYADVKFNKIDLQFVENFELYLKTNGSCCHNSTMKHIQTFKTIFKAACAYGYTVRDPFQKYKIRMEEVVREYLNEKEIAILMELDLPPSGLSIVRDLFVFCCFTGLAYIDLKSLSVRNIQNDNGKYWIRTRRQKTNIKSNVPLLETALRILKKYCPDVDTGDIDGKIFRVISNQKMNAYLKTLAKISGIKKDFTFHIARHTFATTITLNNGVPIESVSSMLGHKHIATTQHYAKLLDKKLEVDMDVLRGKLAHFS